ncbi:MAG: response regulator [Proteobacteria bacterium]|nr:response regulator [Pseudomonadota bacterium]MBU1611718.1 response regulator [Pseudomonadota bacterium]
MFNILIAEDDRVHAVMLERYLHMLGHETVIVDNGRKVLEHLEQHPCDLILMDLQMPEMSGLEAARAIRKLTTDTNQVPIIAITAHAEDDCTECFLAGMNDVLIKPVLLAQVISTINAHVPGADQTAPKGSTTN